MAMTDILLALVPLFVVVDPLASIGLYLGLTQRNTAAERNAIAVKAALFASCVLLVFAFLGRQLLDYLGIELYSLQVAGGILLTIIGLNMLKEGEEPGHHDVDADALPVHTGGSTSALPKRHDPSLVPLGLPMLAGPGAISLVIVQTTSFGFPTIGVAIALTMAAALAILLIASKAQRFIGENGARVITRIMGLLTVAFAVQYIFDGVNGWLATR
ncbi:MAG: MarC family protein [Candidatus Thermoplasmatota archaeon]|jgi:multiple antibiotic resistance protein